MHYYDLEFFKYNTIDQKSSVFPFLPGKCNIEYQKLGCFVDKQPKTSTLALPEKMLKEVVNWDQWNVWLPDFVCRCANLVYENNYNVFGIHLFGMFTRFLFKTIKSDQNL